MQVRQEQANAKDRARAWRAIDLELSAHHIDEHPADGQAQARPAACWAAEPREGLEDALHLGFGDARAGVLDLEGRHLASMAHPHRHRPALGKLHRIAQHIDQHLAQPLLVDAHHRRQLALGAEFEHQAPRPRLRLDHADDLLQEVLEVERPDLEGQLSALDARDVERALDERQQVVAAAPDDIDRLPPMRGDGASPSRICA